MKFFFKFFFVVIFLIISLFGNSQEDFDIVKIDNSDFPYIEVSIRANDNFKPDQFMIIEKDEKVDYIRDTILLSKEKKNLSVLFVLNEKPKRFIVNSLIKTVRTLSEKDELNIAFILDDDTTNQLIHHMSPEFSDNHYFFINILEQKLMNTIDYKGDNKNHTALVNSEQKLFVKQEAYSNKGIIFLGDELILRENSHSSIFTNKTHPVYILLLKEPDEENQNKLIDLCMQTGGIYTITEKDQIEKNLSKYLEDISLHVSSSGSRLYRILFKTNQTKEKNFFHIKYKEKEEQYTFTKPPGFSISDRERVLIALIALLFFAFIVLFFNTRRSKKEFRNKIKSATRNFIFTDKIKPFEINVKTEGFNKTYFLEKHIIKIGRSSDNDIIIPDRTVSGSHAVINKEGDFYMVQDAGSTNGVFVNGKKITKHRLRSKDRIKLGSAVLIVRL
jgi:hypothetical protein